MPVPLLVLGLCLCLCVSAEEPANKSSGKESELESIRFQIKNIQGNIKEAQGESDLLQKELMENEIAISETAVKLRDIAKNIAIKKVRLQELEKEKNVYEDNLKKEKSHLIYQIRTAYRIGRNNYLKLLLNQEDPALVGRVLAYYDYHNRARIERINTINGQLAAITRVEETIKTETGALEQLGNRQNEKLEEFNHYRASRKGIIDRLSLYIEEQGSHLARLQENERELENLLRQLREEETSTVEIYEDIPDFNTLKGKLIWPVEGKISNRFGTTKKGGKLKWQGIILSTDSGAEVRAVGSGKVIFADWFRNMGLLIILDHGGGYMSLYGHNQSLAKKTGDWVLANEMIALAGDSGGQSQPGLYFEIRKDGIPLNPSLWCQNIARRD